MTDEFKGVNADYPAPAFTSRRARIASQSGLPPVVNPASSTTGMGGAPYPAAYPPAYPVAYPPGGAPAATTSGFPAGSRPYSPSYVPPTIPPRGAPATPQRVSALAPNAERIHTVAPIAAAALPTANSGYVPGVQQLAAVAATLPPPVTPPQVQYVSSPEAPNWIPPTPIGTTAPAIAPFAEVPFGEEPEGPKPHKRWRTLVGIGVTLALFLVAGIIAVNTFSGLRDWLGRTTNVAVAPDYPGPGAEPVLVTIPSGATGTMMGELLYEAGVVASMEAFRNAFQANPRANSIQPGTYELQKEMSAAGAVSTMLESGTISLRLVIPEGFTAAQVFARITAVTGIPAEEIEAALQDTAALGLPEQAEGNVEGWLFPATYQIQPGESATSVLRTLIGRTRQELASQNVPPEDWERVLNMASLVEREVRDPDDRPKVARAIMNRIDRGMALQIDAAVAYGLGISGTQLTLAHLADPSNPFNTYQHTGLPPTPIANPGAAAIRAVMNPAEGNYIFWVTINLATGETIFTDTYAEHQVYVAQLREWQAANPGFGQPAPGEHQTG